MCIATLTHHFATRPRNVRLEVDDALSAFIDSCLCAADTRVGQSGGDLLGDVVMLHGSVVDRVHHTVDQAVGHAVVAIGDDQTCIKEKKTNFSCIN